MGSWGCRAGQIQWVSQDEFRRWFLNFIQPRALAGQIPCSQGPLELAKIMWLPHAKHLANAGAEAEPASGRQLDPRLWQPGGTARCFNAARPTWPPAMSCAAEMQARLVLPRLAHHPFLWRRPQSLEAWAASSARSISSGSGLRAVAAWSSSGPE